MKRLANCVIQHERDQAILLIHHQSPELGIWELPGGTIEPEDKITDVAAYAAYQKLGLIVMGLRKIGGTEFSEGGMTYNSTWLLPASTHGHPTPREVEYDAAKYFPLYLIDGDRFSQNVLLLTRNILQGTVKL